MAAEVKMYKVDKSLYPEDRYRKHRRYIDDNGNEVQETYDDIEITEKPADYYHSVETGEENKLDLIASRYYNNESLWWVIAEASGIDDPFNVPVGTVLRIPDMSTLYGLRGILT
jgi:hypothetical protein